MTEQTEREAFEKVYEKLIGVVYKTPWKFERESWDENRYKDDSVQFSWEIWQARAQQPIAQEPVELTFEMIEDSFPEKVCEGIALPGISASWLHEFARAIWALRPAAQQPEAVPVVPEGWKPIETAPKGITK